MSESKSIIERLTAAQEWMRDPDFASVFTVARILAWTARRPVSVIPEAMAEIHRLRTVNAELVEALRWISNTYDERSYPPGCLERTIGDRARAALAKAEGRS